MEKRKNERVEIKIWAANNSNQEVAIWLGEDYLDKNLDFKFCYSTKNVSTSGIFLETQTPLEIGCLLYLEFGLPQTDMKIEVIGKVVRVIQNGDYNDGMGLEFINVSEKDKQLLVTFVEKYYGNSNN